MMRQIFMSFVVFGQITIFSSFVAGVNYESDSLVPFAERIRRQKDQEFWNFLEKEGQDLEDREQILQKAEGIAQSEENPIIQNFLLDSVSRIRKAARDVLLADGALRDLAAQSGDELFIQGQKSSTFNASMSTYSMLNAIYKKLTGEVDQGQIDGDIKKRQSLILPFLDQQAYDKKNGLAGILENCRIAQAKAFDVRKFDLYHKYTDLYKEYTEGKAEFPPTSEAAKAVAEQLVELSGAVRSKYTKGITELAKGIANDVTKKHDTREKIQVDDSSINNVAGEIAKAANVNKYVSSARESGIVVEAL